MTDQEKIDHAHFHTEGGYLKTHNYKEAFRKAWDGASEEEKQQLFALPNFDAGIFEEISGVDVNEDVKVTITCEGKSVEISRESAKALNLI